VATNGLATAQPLYQAQALWEESTASVVIGELHLSSLLNDEVKSEMNKMVAGYIRDGRWANINQIELNNVCDAGPDVLAALQEFNEGHAAAKR
jgi:hypothetical protein